MIYNDIYIYSNILMFYDICRFSPHGYSRVSSHHSWQDYVIPSFWMTRIYYTHKNVFCQNHQPPQMRYFLFGQISTKYPSFVSWYTDILYPFISISHWNIQRLPMFMAPITGDGYPGLDSIPSRWRIVEATTFAHLDATTVRSLEAPKRGFHGPVMTCLPSMESMSWSIGILEPS